MLASRYNVQARCLRVIERYHSHREFVGIAMDGIAERGLESSFQKILDITLEVTSH